LVRDQLGDIHVGQVCLEADDVDVAVLRDGHVTGQDGRARQRLQRVLEIGGADVVEERRRSVTVEEMVKWPW